MYLRDSSERFAETDLAERLERARHEDLAPELPLEVGLPLDQRHPDTTPREEIRQYRPARTCAHDYDMRHIPSVHAHAFMS